ncbi:MAG: T9SS type A sorting domain-containing protein [Candidatus Cloacimonetes bacterium]|nr:T9SS type A sorting domain-containing protein [Candidatus Cloacimonadota bacterium]MDD2506391.1 T9SS type A sorting domain-containing protein [Candidatus Cloacimonadota bacterium]MDD4148248.1 T9SS type A sorting domain-containing protein [Candidatus Cloacimonadota bacterium]MDD4559796.1 T9SS type A sorting domain-containing protein [Candidatus Cloacimonadota bacterium]
MNSNISGLRLPKLLLIVALLLLHGFAAAELLYVVNSQSRTLSRIDTETDTVDNSFSVLGTVPNKIVVDEDYIWSVNSGDNAVQKISRESGNTISNIFVGLGANPWDALKHETKLYVSGWLSQKVYKLDTISGTVEASVDVGVAPEDLELVGNKLYVCNAGNYSQNYAGSSVSVIDLESFTVLSTIPVSANPQHLASYEGKLHVSCTGNWGDTAGVICIIDTSTDTVVETIDIGGTPGALWIAGTDLALVADGNGAHLYSYNPSTFTILHGDSNPLPNACSGVVGNSNVVALLTPNWGGNGIVEILHPDLSNWKQYTVGMMPTDLKLYNASSFSEDQIAIPAQLSVSPNPARQGSSLKFSSPEALNGELSLYNLKGQKLKTYPYQGSDLTVSDAKLSSGVYFYSLQDGKGMKSKGKLVILK